MGGNDGFGGDDGIGVNDGAGARVVSYVVAGASFTTHHYHDTPNHPRHPIHPLHCSVPEVSVSGRRLELHEVLGVSE